MSDNLRMLGKYSAAMEAGDTDAVFEFWSEDFHSHVTERVSPERVGTDVRGGEVEWWTQARAAFPDMTFTVNLLIEKGRPRRLELDGEGHPHRHRVLRRPAVGRAVEINGTAILRIRDGQIVEHWGGPHCQEGLGLIR